MSYERENVYAALPSTTRGQPLHLGGDPKGKNFLYANGNCVFIRNIENPLICDMYTEHSLPVTVARYSPSGFYIASADVGGHVRIWDTVNPEHLTKWEYRPIAGIITDLAWTEDSKRLIVSGKGNETFGAAFLVDSGSSVGTITGHEKPTLSCDMRQQRPYRAATCGEDFCMCFFAGPPFKLNKTQKTHTRFCNCVRYSPNGDFLVTVGSDCKGYLFDGKTGEELGVFEGGEGHETGHTGGILSVSWSPDSTKILTAAMDKTARIWDVETKQVLHTFTFGDALEDQQVGSLWQGEHLLTVSLSGHINYLDINNPSTPLRILLGNQKTITSLALTGNAMFTGSADSRLTRYERDSGAAQLYVGAGAHTNEILSLAASIDGSQIISAGKDDSVRSHPSTDTSFGTECVSTKGAANCVAVHGDDTVVVACYSELIVLNANKKVFSMDIAYIASGCAVHPNGTEVSVVGNDKKLHVYAFTGSAIGDERATVDLNGLGVCVAYSPDGSKIATGDSGRYVLVTDSASLEVIERGWCFHASRVDTVAFSPDGKHIASGALDTNIFVWDLEKRTKRIPIKRAHAPGGVTRVVWADDNTIVSAGVDCTVKSWKITFH